MKSNGIFFSIERMTRNDVIIFLFLSNALKSIIMVSLYYVKSMIDSLCNKGQLPIAPC